MTDTQPTPNPCRTDLLPMPYRCSSCQSEGVRLWREYQVLTLERTSLLCRACCEAAQAKEIAQTRTQGLDRAAEESHTIGWWVPAVPTEDGSFWGYLAVPELAVAWWEALPTTAP